ncbi:uncharacterized protein LOC107481072 [Arachis duranensis]|uniref:Uncharacterized protein LOC107481072 n=1 Tax=Arachis duranensis TaxID=130453 RepID=A0A6P4CSV2_ARADU|nr:uncharacterized protein LOC107481072 [Arachis duranensis]
MGTKVQNLPGYYSMRDLNEESSSCGWPLFYGDNKALVNGQYYHDYMPSATTDACSAYEKDAVKQTMLEHEAVFKNQVFELHRLYRIQKDLMDEVKMKALHRNQIPVETSFSAGIEGTCSPSSSNKGANKQASLFPSPNGSSSKDVEVLESRPSKARRKMFDLHLPADEYIDTEENDKLNDEKISGTAIFLPERDSKHGKGADVKPFFGNGGNTGSQEDTSRSEQFLRSRSGLADLNEPVQVEETNETSCVPFSNHNQYQEAPECSDLSAKQKSRFFCLSREELLNSHHGTDSWARNNGYSESNENGKGWISSVLEAGHAKGDSKYIPQVHKQEHSPLSSQTMKDALRKTHEPTYGFQINQSKAEFWRVKSDLDTSERHFAYSTNKHPEPVGSSHRPGFFAITPSSDLSRSWSHSPSLEMASGNLGQKLVSIQTAPSQSGALNRSSQPQQSNGILGNRWHTNINSKLNPGFQYDVPVQNGFYPGSASGSKELSVNISSISYDYLNHSNDCKRIPEHFNNGSAKYFKSSNSKCNDMTSGKDINLNVMLSNSSSNSLVSQSGLGIRNSEQKREEQLAVLPWLRAMSTCKNEVQNADRSLTAGESSFSYIASLSNKDEISKGSGGEFLRNIASGLRTNDIERKGTEICEGSTVKKILGVPIFDTPQVSPKEPNSLTSPSLSVPKPSGLQLLKNNGKNWLLDINLPCDDDVIELDDEAVTETFVSKKGSPATGGSSRNQIDLNLSMSEDEEFVTPPTTNVNTKAEIDLEVPALPDTEEDATPEERQIEIPEVLIPGPPNMDEQQQDEVIKCAAEAIVVMSTLCCSQVDDVISIPSGSPMEDPLSWFVDFVSSCVDDLERKLDNSREHDGEDNEESSSGEIDYFESMTLKLAETKEEDYMPTPLVPEDFKVEESGTTSLPSRTRKGSARRGRQRRDFQRDILPGLTTLSRHEVTEDLQIFGGLMRATGHSWQSGLTRRSSSRNGGGRGRRRVQVGARQLEGREDSVARRVILQRSG